MTGSTERATSVDLASAFDRARTYATQQDRQFASVGLPTLAGQAFTQQGRAQRAAFVVAGLIEGPGADDTGWLQLAYVALSALAAGTDT